MGDFTDGSPLIEGGTDSTIIGNIGDRLKVDSTLTGSQSVEPGFRWDDMSVANGGIARNTVVSTTFTNIYNITGDGLLFGWSVALENNKDEWYIRVRADGLDVLGGSAGISNEDLEDGKIYGWQTGLDSQRRLGINLTNKHIVYHCPYPIKFVSTVQIQIRKVGGDKKFRAGLVQIVR